METISFKPCKNLMRSVLSSSALYRGGTQSSGGWTKMASHPVIGWDEDTGLQAPRAHAPDRGRAQFCEA